MAFADYVLENYYDEWLDQTGQPRPDTEVIVELLKNMGMDELKNRQFLADQAMKSMGIAFRVYGDHSDDERVIPFDILPRIIDGLEWDRVEAGLKQRVKTINLFINDVYHNQNIIKDKVVPEWLLHSSVGYLPECKGIRPPGDVWCHISGVDLVRDDKGTFYVLEDNLRVPSGSSYVLINRELTKRNFPEVFSHYKVRPVMDYPQKFVKMIHQLVPNIESPNVVVLSPGILNSAYFEHAYLAQKMGARLVEGRDLIYDGKHVCMKSTLGLIKVDVIYRRIDDHFLDPLVFRPDSILGCAGIMQAFQDGNVAIINAPGTGVADDKVVYAFVPKMIEYYLGEKPILPSVPTHLCYEKEALEYTLDNLRELVVKPASESGGYGMLIGPRSESSEIEEFRRRLKENPRNYISQPTLSLSRAPIIDGDEFGGRHVDLRPFVIHGPEEIYVMAGGLTRVALRKGSLVVNSSQGGGTKDTWIVDKTGEK
jgi:uncharacterized circularly permuted ATP-grasp superfamily protein